MFVIKKDELSAAETLKGNATVAAFFDLDEDVRIDSSLHALNYDNLHQTLS
jgi:hypothetical protein